MDTMVVQDVETSKILYRQRKVKCLSLERSVRFRIKDQFRTPQNIKDKLLPLPSLEDVQGAPQYMVIFDITKIYAMRQTCKLSSAFSIPVSRTYREQHSSQFTNDCLSLISQVNLLILEPRNEHLRETLFWTIFRNTIIFKDLDDAIDYGTKLAKRNQPPMAMYSEDGQKILGDGILDPHSSPPSKLDYVFGMQSPCNTTEFSSITSGKF